MEGLVSTAHLLLISRSSLAVLVALLVASCLQNGRIETRSSCDPGEAGEQCALEGRLTIYANNYGSLGVLNIDADCVALSLPSKVLENRRSWEGAFVAVKGVVYTQPTGTGVVSYELAGREVLAGMCEKGKILHVTDIRKIN